MKQWKMASPSSETVALLCREQIPPLTAHLLAVRRITTIEAARNFCAATTNCRIPSYFRIWTKR